LTATPTAKTAHGKSYGKRKSQALYGRPYTHKPDTDNCIKSVLDGANGVAYEDDAQVTTIRAYKRYILADEQPHVDVFISPIT
jgi:Holliday junction resolvase RusA-like endonuclease